MFIDFLLEDAKLRVGEPRPVPEFGIRITPLSRDKVKNMSDVEGKKERVKRATYVDINLQNYVYNNYEYSRFYIDEMKKAEYEVTSEPRADAFLAYLE
jgi:hypothetical protein